MPEKIPARRQTKTVWFCAYPCKSVSLFCELFLASRWSKNPAYYHSYFQSPKVHENLVDAQPARYVFTGFFTGLGALTYKRTANGQIRCVHGVFSGYRCMPLRAISPSCGRFFRHGILLPQPSIGMASCRVLPPFRTVVCPCRSKHNRMQPSLFALT